MESSKRSFLVNACSTAFFESSEAGLLIDPFWTGEKAYAFPTTCLITPVTVSGNFGESTRFNTTVATPTFPSYDSPFASASTKRANKSFSLAEIETAGVSCSAGLASDFGSGLAVLAGAAVEGSVVSAASTFVLLGIANVSPI
ncbi:Uncharacterised protein [Streptococcus pneumoniae]|nr:Uncharacterised protein [Streptococcus pneumoniae]